MSFTTDVKNELCSCELSKKQEKIFFYGFTYCLKQREYFTESEAVKEIIRHIGGDKISVLPHKRRSRSGFLIDLSSVEADESDQINAKLVDGRDENTGLFLRGAFISCGVVSDPNKEYHLEFSVGSEEKSKNLCRLINESGMKIKISCRRGKYILYTKDSEAVSDILTYMGAMICSMEIMNAKIFKGVRNNVNRAVNCESANIDKTVAASRKQAEDIEYIAAAKGLGMLTEDLRQIAELRRDNLELSLSEIGKLLDPEISRSAVYRRMKRIGEIADSLKTKKDDR
ncbi:MAG: DNA-binding protein WhiA [Firmicutes bacterium]|nr:DNA-binding protein WhiA [[Eubacterium] siraeum]MCM1487111.1 DNA-binding protein WhiA [Bacillota bacterium]